MRTEKKSIQSIDRAIDILNLLSKHPEPMSAVDISSTLDINRTTTYGILATLVSRDYVSRDSNGKYSIGLKMFENGSLFVQRLPLVKQATPYMTKLSNQYNVSVHLGVCNSEDEVLIIEAIVPLKNDEINQVLPFPIYASGLGKVMLAHQSQEEIQRIIKNLNFHKLTINTITSAGDLIVELENIRKLGFASDNGEYFDNTYCLAFPIRDHSNKVFAALSLAGTKDEIEKNRDTIIRDGLQTSKYLSLELGWRPSSII